MSRLLGLGITTESWNGGGKQTRQREGWSLSAESLKYICDCHYKTVLKFPVFPIFLYTPKYQ